MPGKARDGRNLALKGQFKVTSHSLASLIVQKESSYRLSTYAQYTYVCIKMHVDTQRVMYKLIHTTLPVAGIEARSSSRPMTKEFITVGASIALLLHTHMCIIVKATLLNIPLTLRYTAYYIEIQSAYHSLYYIAYCATDYKP